jgi:hypothetical protein
MTALSITKVAKAAPAASSPRNPDREKLIDTSRFLRYVAQNHGMKPVLAVQGTAHRDATTVKERAGRHIVAAVNDRGMGFALLNSHYKDRRAHIGLCMVQPGTDDMIVFDSKPVQRWKGFEPVVESCAEKLPEARSVADALAAWTPSAGTLKDLAVSMARDGYLSTASLHPVPESLFDNYDGDALGYAFHLVRKMKRGRLPSSVPGTRRVRAIRRPDTLLHAGMIAFELVKERAQHLGRLSARCSFVLTDKRFVRP